MVGNCDTLEVVLDVNMGVQDLNSSTYIVLWWELLQANYFSSLSFLKYQMEMKVRLQRVVIKTVE